MDESDAYYATRQKGEVKFANIDYITKLDYITKVNGSVIIRIGQDSRQKETCSRNKGVRTEKKINANRPKNEKILNTPPFCLINSNLNSNFFGGVINSAN